MKKTNIKGLIIDESRYSDIMNEAIEPWLALRRTILWPEREPGRKLYCESYQADQPTATVLISHGFTESSEKYREFIYTLLRNHLNAVIFDHCGHGKSYRLVKDLNLVHVDSWRRYVDDLLYIGDEIRKKNPSLPLYLYGHSMGGGIAAASAAIEPWLFRKMILNAPMIEPKLGNIPLPIGRILAGSAGLIGKKQAFVGGKRAYIPEEDTFENSPDTSEARFNWYAAKRKDAPLLQTCAPSYGWIQEACAMSAWLLNQGCKQILIPFILFQAQDDTLVSGEAQTRFVQNANRQGENLARLIRVPGSKHEIYFSENSVLEQYMRIVLSFFQEDPTEPDQKVRRT